MMNLGQTLIAILALVFLLTMATNINRARLAAISATVDNMVDQEAINFGQSVLEKVSHHAQNSDGFRDLESIFDPNVSFVETFDSGRTLYAFVEIEVLYDSNLDTTYKKATVSVYTEEEQENIRSQSTASYITWWLTP